MKGSKSLADRGMIPRMLSGIFRKSRAIEKSTNGDTSVTVSMSYYEIYNDRVYDLFETPDKRTPTGLPIREAEGGKTVVVGLTEASCQSLKDFETLYDRANSNRSTGATKLNAQSSRSHAILCVKLVVSTPTEDRISTASAIDLAGSEDNRRTGNVKERMVESASINKSLFVLAQCVEAIGKKQQRIPYRESKMTRILSLGQNNGFTVMILNLAPVHSYHLDTLSSLNFANRTKKIEVREVENEPIFKGPPRQPAGMASITGSNIQRQPLRPLTNAVNVNLAAQKSDKTGEKPLKAFSVYSDRNTTHRPFQTSNKSPLKRSADSSFLASARPNKIVRPTSSFIRRGPEPQTLTKQSIETLVEQKVSEILASRAQDASQQPNATSAISEEVQRRLNKIEDRLAGQEGERAEGLSYLFMAKQHQARGEDSSALKMYQLARPYFPENEKLAKKIEALQEKMHSRREAPLITHTAPTQQSSHAKPPIPENIHNREIDLKDEDDSYHAEDDEEGDSSYHSDSSRSNRKTTKRRNLPPKPHTHLRQQKVSRRPSSPDPLHVPSSTPTSPGQTSAAMTPRTSKLLTMLSTRDTNLIKSLPGIGTKRAETIVDALRTLSSTDSESSTDRQIGWNELIAIPGIGKKTLESMRAGIVG